MSIRNGDKARSSRQKRKRIVQREKARALRAAKTAKSKASR